MQEGSELSRPCSRHLRKHRKVSCKLSAVKHRGTLWYPGRLFRMAESGKSKAGGQHSTWHPPGLGTQCMLCPGFLPHPLSWTSQTLLDVSLNHSFHFACSSVGSHRAGLGELSLHCREAILSVELGPHLLHSLSLSYTENPVHLCAGTTASVSVMDFLRLPWFVVSSHTGLF